LPILFRIWGMVRLTSNRNFATGCVSEQATSTSDNAVVSIPRRAHNTLSTPTTSMDEPATGVLSARTGVAVVL
jgi:hypothetical protein